MHIKLTYNSTTNSTHNEFYYCILTLDTRRNDHIGFDFGTVQPVPISFITINNVLFNLNREPTFFGSFFFVIGVTYSTGTKGNGFIQLIQ